MADEKITVFFGEKNKDGVYQAQMALGTPVIMRCGSEIYGRVTKVDGGVLHIVSPHGSTVSAGMVWFHPVETEAEKAKLAEFDADALAKNGKVEGLIDG